MEDSEEIQIINIKKEKDVSKYCICECGKIIFATNRSSHKKRPSHLKRIEDNKNMAKVNTANEIVEALIKLRLLYNNK